MLYKAAIHHGSFFFGRQLFTICPFELVTAKVVKFGLKHKVPKPFKSGWIVTLLYAFIAINAILSWSIHRLPNRMALYLIIFFVLRVWTPALTFVRFAVPKYVGFAVPKKQFRG
ncbi:MAG: hypothetical protein H8E61_09990 [Bacteroidetes bacterium]|nr:hypothetical protein [Bacteroidota bacterium]